MILERGLYSIIQNLDSIISKDQDRTSNVSSHVTLKERGLKCLRNLLEQAPSTEYHDLFNAKDHEILLGYTMNILCRLAKDDKSRSIRKASLDTLKVLFVRLEGLHDYASNKVCTINIVKCSLPGVSSCLFRLIMSDTKLPKSVLLAGIDTLTKLIVTSFRACWHDQNDIGTKDDSQNISDLCDNLSIRLAMMIDYIIQNHSELSSQVLESALNLCDSLICISNTELLRRLVKPIVRFVAFTSSTESFNDIILEITNHFKTTIEKQKQKCDNLDSLVISSLMEVIDDLECHNLTMLSTERESHISLIYGYLRLMPQSSMDIIFEMDDRKQQFVKIFSRLVEFSTQQPFLFLMDVEVGSRALERVTDRICTLEKRFANLTNEEARLISSCCYLVGKTLDWQIYHDMFRTELSNFTSPNNLFISHLLLKGLDDRPESDMRVSQFVEMMIRRYIDQATESYLSINDTILDQAQISKAEILIMIIAIETVVTLISLHCKFSRSQSDKTLALQVVLCPLLNWASSSNRAISEAALNSLGQISDHYGYNSISNMIESNIDYIVDGVSQMLDTFYSNPEITGVLAITLKLSSIENFYYFKDIYDRIFKILALHYNDQRSRSIALLFQRTLEILSHWKESTTDMNESPFDSEEERKKILDEHSIDIRLENLDRLQADYDDIKMHLDEPHVDEKDVKAEIESGKLPKGTLDDDHDHDEPMRGEDEDETQDAPNKKSNAPDIVFTEKIMNNCVNLILSNDQQTKILALKSASHGFKILAEDENTLLPLVHQFWDPLIRRLTSDYGQNLELTLSAFECLVSMAKFAKDFIKRRTLDSIIPRLCLFLEKQAKFSKNKKEYGPYCMTTAYKCQLAILSHLGDLVYSIQLGYRSLWTVVRTTLLYLDSAQITSLREAAYKSLVYMIALDADCVWFYAKSSGHLHDLPFELIYKNV